MFILQKNREKREDMISIPEFLPDNEIMKVKLLLLTREGGNVAEIGKILEMSFFCKIVENCFSSMVISCQGSNPRSMVSDLVRQLLSLPEIKEIQVIG